jgi:hypothetical protein
MCTAAEHGWAATVMTRQYLIGELSLLLAELQAASTDQASSGDAALLRRQAETLPPSALASVVVPAIRLAERLCWDSVTRGDAAAFNRQATASAKLYEFAVCADLLTGEQHTDPIPTFKPRREVEQ